MISFFSFIVSTAFSQRTVNLPDHDMKPLHYGFQIGGQVTTYKIRHSNYFLSNQDSVISISPIPTTSFSLGFILDFSIYEEEWDLRLNPNASFVEQQVEFAYREGSTFTESVEAAFFELPVLLKYKSTRRGNMGMYMTAGFVPSIKVGGRRRKEDPARLGIDDVNLEVTYGLGFDLYQSFFKFAPEIRFSHGLKDMIFQNGSSFGRNIERITTHRVSIFLNFEG